MRNALSLRPCGIRANGKMIRCTKHTDIRTEPVVRHRDDMPMSTHVATALMLTGVKGEPEDGRFEFWTEHWYDDAPQGFWYHHYLRVEWEGQFGIAYKVNGNIGGMVIVEKRLQGLRQFKAFMKVAT